MEFFRIFDFIENSQKIMEIHYYYYFTVRAPPARQRATARVVFSRFIDAFLASVDYFPHLGEQLQVFQI